MKKLFSLLIWLLMFWAWAYAQDIQLNPGWNAISTPAYLSDLTFSNGWEWISFTTLKDWSWISVPALIENIKPLEGFMVYNANSSTVTLTLDYKENPTPAESIWQKQLSRWWNLLGITTTDDPFKWIDATMFVDPTLWWRYTVSNWIANPELGEAYFVFVSDWSIYGWVNTTEVAANEVVEEQPEVVEPEPVIVDNNKQINISKMAIFNSTPTVYNWEQPSIVWFKVEKKSKDIDHFELKSITIQWIEWYESITENDINLRIDWTVYPMDVSIDNWKIVITWLEDIYTSSSIYIDIYVNKNLELWLLKYKLIEVNWVETDLDFTTNFIDLE